ncbi:MAG TPA: bacillithiol biosynthesis deacetylase BshB1 [Vicinamibacterales bacterium]|nr:bacillithiol biosynthesis deacetylase BshB1 [Vicinamibacterales bacterium]
MAVDLLVFGPHPDDLEIGLGGTIARHVAMGSSVGLCDMTAGEMGSNGTVEQRLAEAEDARLVLGAAWRENLRLPDREIGKHPHHLLQVATFVRQHRPRVVAAPYWSDRHPDHVAASALVTEGVFNAGLRKYKVEGEAWKVDWICYYFINDGEKPSFVVDVSEYYETKRQALDCHVTQFQLPAPGAASTRLNTPLFRQLIESRDAQFGALSGVTWAEGFVVRDPVPRAALFKRL